MRLCARVMVGIAMTLAASACGGSGQLSVDYGRACRLMTDDEAAEALGVDVYPGEADTDRTIPASFCEWRAEGSLRGEGDDAFSVWVAEGSDEDSIEEFEHDRRDDAVGIPDLGDEAFFHVQGTASVPWIEVRVGDHVATIGVSGSEDHPVTTKQARRIELDAAVFVVPRL